MASDNDNLTLDGLPLGAEFPAATREQWAKLVDGVLKGGSFDRLKGKTSDGLPIEPLYPRAGDAKTIAGRPAGAPWQIMQRVDHPDAAKANALALIDLENGATGLTLVFAGANGSAGYGLEPTAKAVKRALQDVYLNGIGVELQLGWASRDIALHVAELAKASGAKAEECDIRFGLDPIGSAAVAGGSDADWASTSRTLGDIVTKVIAQGFSHNIVVADGRVIHDAGGSEAQELAYVLGCAVAYMRALEASGLSLADARKAISARLSADADQFMSMAKFRALRKLFARIDQACGLAPSPLFVAGESAWRMVSQRDTDVNMLRMTMATFAAGLGGADSITVLPHTLALGLPDEFARRVARNTQLILLEESNLEKVSDPAAGAGGIETLTTQLCAKAWELFQAIEKSGGIFAALAAETIQQQVAEVRARRDKDIARRKDVITGVSEFANLAERAPNVLDPAPHVAPRIEPTAVEFDALHPRRLATAFEQLRDRSDRLKTTARARPKIFLANLGTPAAFTARATFAKSFFEAGGLEALDNEGYWEIPTLVHEYRKTGATLVCLCSSDEVYATNAIDAAKALTDAGAEAVFLAGRPGDKEALYREAGITDFVYVGVDALAVLRDAHAKAGSGLVV